MVIYNFGGGMHSCEWGQQVYIRWWFLLWQLWSVFYYNSEGSLYDHTELITHNIEEFCDISWGLEITRSRPDCIKSFRSKVSGQLVMYAYAVYTCTFGVVWDRSWIVFHIRTSCTVMIVVGSYFVNMPLEGMWKGFDIPRKLHGRQFPCFQLFAGEGFCYEKR